jgi:V8-like Glu-specific endopeptidase
MHVGSRGLSLATLLVFSACGGQIEGTDQDSTAVTLQPIVGGVAASDYLEAAYINIDATPVSAYVCSGTLIAPEVVLTAGHCVDTHSRWEVHVAGAYRVSTSTAVFDWNEQGSSTVNPAHHDVGLIFLNQPVTVSHYPTLSKAAAAIGASATCVGRVVDGSIQSGAYRADTTIFPADPVGYHYDYMSPVLIQPGDSGGPVFLSGTHEIAAVNSGAGAALQVLARVDLVRDWIVSQVESHGGFGSDTSIGTAGAGGASSGGTTGIASTPGAAGGGGDTVCSGSSEVEPNDGYTSAANLTGTVCGSLATATDRDWYVTRLSAGNHVLALDPTGDASVNVGIASRLGCVLAYKGIRSLNINVATGSAKLCIQVLSSGRRTQDYSLSVD